MRTSWRLLALLGTVTPAVPAALEAQFVTPLPKPSDAERFRIGRFQHRFDRRIPAADRKAIRNRAARPERIIALRDSICATWKADSMVMAACRNAVDSSEVLTRKTSTPPSQARVVLPFRFPGWHRRYDIEDYLETTTSDRGLSLFSRFAANVSDDEAYVTSDLISGLVDRVMFAVNYAAVVVRDETATSETEQRVIESQKANVLRMINNGGTLTGRVQVPMHATTGPTFQHASSIYLTAGAIGPAGNVDSLNFSGSLVMEAVTGFAVRQFTQSADELGQVVAAARVGYAFSESELLVDSDDKGFGFAQLALGLVQKGAMSLSVLITWSLEDRYDPFTPKLVVNFAAIR
jgi:hypothetical protein